MLQKALVVRQLRVSYLQGGRVKSNALKYPHTVILWWLDVSIRALSLCQETSPFLANADLIHPLQVGRTDLRELLLACCGDEAPDVRQSAFALLGDLAKVSAGVRLCTTWRRRKRWGKEISFFECVLLLIRLSHSPTSGLGL